jgi:glycerol kinase
MSRSETSLILALDQSTSATKAILFDATGRMVDRAARPHRQIYPRPGWVEHDADEIWRNVLAVIRRLARRNPRRLAQLAALSIANQRETFVVFDRQTGRPLHHAIVWQDRRGDPLCARLAKQGRDALIRRKTGLKLDTYFSASKLNWLITHNPAIAARLRAGTAVIGTIDTYLLHRLTGGQVFATDFTNASRTLLFDIRRLRWDAELCRLFKVPLAALPEVRESAAQFGATDVAGLLPKAVPICGVMGDSQAALFAHGCFAPGTAKATFGTGTSVLLNIGRKPVITKNGGVTALAWVFRGQPTYAQEGLVNFSAATLEWLKNQLGLIRPADAIEPLARDLPDNGGVYLVPAFAGLSAPYWSPEARAAILGLTAFTRREHIVRAALESIAYQIRDILDLLQSGSKTRLRQLHADGGPTRNAFLMQFTADITGVPLNVAELSDASAWGAAMNGLLGCGVYPGLAELARLPARSKRFQRRMKPAAVSQLYAGWQKAVNRVL